MVTFPASAVTRENHAKLLWLRDSFGWMGQHSGYEMLCEMVSEQWPGQQQAISSGAIKLPFLFDRLLNKQISKWRTSETYNSSGFLLETNALWHSLVRRYDLMHIVYLERCLGFLPNWKRRLSFRLIGTAHQPAGLWRLGRHNPEQVSSLDALIVLSSQEVSFFEQYIPGRVHCVLHGVDSDFFCPSQHQFETPRTDNPRCIFSGTWLRDLRTLAQVIDEVVKRDPSIQFDMVVPRAKRHEPHFYRVARHSQVHWHSGLSDEELRNLYRQASMLVLPLLDCTANNALLEAIACGKPVISNHIGGMQDYTRENFADLLPVGDVDGFVEAILKLANDEAQCNERGKVARQFAEQTLGWEKIASQTIDIYQKVFSVEQVLAL